MKGVTMLIDRPFASKPGIDWPMAMVVVLIIAALLLAVIM